MIAFDLYQNAWLFEDENYAAFVEIMKAVLDFEYFHGMMRAAARKQFNIRSHK